MGLRDILKAGVAIAGDMIEEWGFNESKADLRRRMLASRDRAAQLALENASLRDKVDELRFNGPTLYKDEVDAIDRALGFLHTRLATELSVNVEGDKAHARSLLRLLDRCDHMPMTEQELAQMADDVVTGKTKVVEWDDIGKDIDEDETAVYRKPPVGREMTDQEKADYLRYINGDDDE